MLIGKKSQLYFKITKSKEKMIEYFIPKEDHIKIPEYIELDDLFMRTLSILGDFCVYVINEEEERRRELSKELDFCSNFFESYMNGEVNKSYNEYMRLIASATYYLCDKVGNSSLLANEFEKTINVNGGGLENLLICIIRNKYDSCKEISENFSYKIFIEQYLDLYKNSCESGDFNKLYNLVIDNRKIVYDRGTARELLLIDLICAILKIKMERFTIVTLPKYTGLSVDECKNFINRDGFIKELWSSQIDLGEKGVYNGVSSVIQMPTSSGKTKSIEIIIRTAMLLNKTKFAIIVTPFRALCREISLDLEKVFQSDEEINISEMSDVLRDDFSENNITKFTVIILTPEKLMYLMRKLENFIDDVGLVIFDEAHLFDDPSRGINYELLVTMIKTYLKNESQKIVISAIISNAEAINGWVNGDTGEVIKNNISLGGEKSIAFIERTFSSKNQFSLHFVENENINEEKYYVPKVVNRIEINKIGKERKSRYFPDDNYLSGDISISIANRLCINGGVAIFCGRKDSARVIVERILDIENRGVDIKSFYNVSDKDEVKRIHNLFKQNLGADNPYTEASKKGVFSHHSNIPEGIKSSIEYSMRAGKIKVIVCTSTLAQGVNLPIRYLLIPTIYQAREEIKVRDFQNLVGRTGRAGMYTEGSVIFTEPGSYINKLGWKWSRYKHLLNKSNSEPCESYIFEIIKYKDKNEEWFNYIINECTKYDINEVTNHIIKFIDDQDIDLTIKEEFKNEIFPMINIIKELENFILSIITTEEFKAIANINELIENTFAYYLANDEQKVLLKDIIMRIYEKVKNGVIDTKKQKIYGRTMLSLSEINIIDQWISKNISIIEEIDTIKQLIQNIFPLLLEIIESSKIIKRVENIQSLIEIYKLWIDGESYYDILLYTRQKEYKIKIRSNVREFNIDEIIEICTNLFGYKTSIVISAIQEILQAYEVENESIANLLDELCRRTRYGVSSLNEVILYELGFNDRHIVKNIYYILGITTLKKSQYKIELKRNKEKIEDFLSEFPSVFKENLNFIIRNS